MVVSSICPNLSKRAIPEGEYYSSILNCINGYVNIHMGKPLYEQALSEKISINYYLILMLKRNDFLAIIVGINKPWRAV